MSITERYCGECMAWLPVELGTFYGSMWRHNDCRGPKTAKCYNCDGLFYFDELDIEFGVYVHHRVCRECATVWGPEIAANARRDRV